MTIQPKSDALCVDRQSFVRPDRRCKKNCSGHELNGPILRNGCRLLAAHFVSDLKSFFCILPIIFIQHSFAMMSVFLRRKNERKREIG